MTDAAPMLLSFDPGLPDCGAALFCEGRLVRAAWCRVPPPPDTLAARASALVDLLDQVEQDLLGGKLERLQGGVLVAEWPRIYRPERAVKGRAYDPAPLLWLAGVCGALADRCASVGARLDLYQAPEWKGQMDKEAHQRIAIHTLTKEEQALIPQMPIAKRPESDALDAALLGAWWLRRAGFRRWAS